MQVKLKIRAKHFREMCVYYRIALYTINCMNLYMIYSYYNY